MPAPVIPWGPNRALLLRELGAPTVARGERYAETGMVVQLSFDVSGLLIEAIVRGSGSKTYQTTVYLDIKRGRHAMFEMSSCSCPVGVNCKHGVAALRTAIDKRERGELSESTGTSWQAVLALALPDEPVVEKLPLAVQLSTGGGEDTGVRYLHARIVRPGVRGWVNDGLTWSAIGTTSTPIIDDHRDLLAEIYALYESGARRARYGHGPGSVKDIDLTTVHSPRLWHLLARADQAGVELVHTSRRLGRLEAPAPARLSTAIERTDAGLSIVPQLVLDGVQVDPADLGYLGSPVHGVFAVDGKTGRIRLGELDRPFPRSMLPLLQHVDPVVVPEGDEQTFTETYLPRLHRATDIESPDGSYTPPEVSGPVLRLTADYGRAHRLDLSWSWIYRIGEHERVHPLHTSEAVPGGHRDVAGEAAVLEQLDLPLTDFGLTGADGTLAPHVRLDGLDTMRATVELLPLLRGREDVELLVRGTVADYREAGDQVRIGVGTSGGDDEAERTDWFELQISVSVGEQEVPLPTILSAMARDAGHLLLDDGAYLSLDKPELVTLRRLVDEARAMADSADTAGAGLQISRFQAGLWEELAALGVVEHQAAAWQAQVRGLLGAQPLEDVPVPRGMQAALRPYQVEGFHWLAFLWRHRLGGILADDMGLGKTLQTLALIAHTRESEVDASTDPFLILAPTSVVSNWAVEAARFTPGLKVVVITETSAKSGRSLAGQCAGADLVITSYTLFRLDYDAYEQVPWAGLVLDEAQFAKNHESKLYHYARRLPARFTLAITGTPLENNLMELWALLSITAPGLFPQPVGFTELYQRPIERDGDTEALMRLRRRIRPLVLRRTKEQVVSDLPEKTEQVLEVTLHPEHRALYDTRLKREQQKILGLIDDLGRNRFTILQSLTTLRQMSLHPGLIDPAHHDVAAAKIDALIEHLAEVIAGGHRALVFSQFTGFLSLVRERLIAEGIEFAYLDGSTRDRGTVIEGFKSGTAPVFLISLKSGGFGLNLTEADYAFILDPWWNPATEAQAIDRAHRIGQTRPVMVYRLIAADTIEDKVMALKERKFALFSSVFDDDGGALSAALDAEDIRALLDG